MIVNTDSTACEQQGNEMPDTKGISSSCAEENKSLFFVHTERKHDLQYKKRCK